MAASQGLDFNSYDEGSYLPPYGDEVAVDSRLMHHRLYLHFVKLEAAEVHWSMAISITLPRRIENYSLYTGEIIDEVDCREGYDNTTASGENGAHYDDVRVWAWP